MQYITYLKQKINYHFQKELKHKYSSTTSLILDMTDKIMNTEYEKMKSENDYKLAYISQDQQYK